MATMTLYEEPGWGSAIIEFQLILYGMTYDRVRVGDIYRDPGNRDVLAPVNPLMQIPALVLPNGEVMTETAAMTLHLADLAGSDRLVPAPGAPERAAFLRWLLFIVPAIYPCFAYALEPERFVQGDAIAQYQKAMMAKHLDLWRIMETEGAAHGGPWFLGKRFSAIDFYIATMVQWRPKPQWFRDNTPMMAAIAAAALLIPELHDSVNRNFAGMWRADANPA